MIVILGIVLTVYVAMGYTAHKELLDYCTNTQDKELVNMFKRKLIIHWAEYAYNVGRIRKVVTDSNKEDLELTAVKFSQTFTNTDRRASKLYADLVLNMKEEDIEDVL